MAFETCTKQSPIFLFACSWYLHFEICPRKVKNQIRELGIPFARFDRIRNKLITSVSRSMAILLKDATHAYPLSFLYCQQDRVSILQYRFFKIYGFFLINIFSLFYIHTLLLSPFATLKNKISWMNWLVKIARFIAGLDNL